MNGVPLHMKGVLVVNPEIGDGHVKNVKPVMCFFFVGRFQGLLDIHGICYNKQRCILICLALVFFGKVFPPKKQQGIYCT